MEFETAINNFLRLMPDWQTIQGWQTLISGVFAVLAALGTIILISCQVRLQGKQIQNEEQRHRDRLTSMSLSAKSRLPDALSALSAYAQSCMNRLKRRQFGELRNVSYPSNYAESVKDAIEFSDPISAKILYEMVVYLQIFKARIEDIIERANRDADLARNISQNWHSELMYDVVLLQAYINHTFNYARNETETIEDSPFTSEMMETALKNCADLAFIVQNREVFNGLYEIIDRRHKNRGRRMNEIERAPPR